MQCRWCIIGEEMLHHPTIYLARYRIVVILTWKNLYTAISPTMLSLMMWLFFGSVEIWHSYSPSSRACTYLTCRVQVSDASTKSAWNLSSGINMVLSTERICESLLLIHDTFRILGTNRLCFNNTTWLHRAQLLSPLLVLPGEEFGRDFKFRGINISTLTLELPKWLKMTKI